MLSHHMYLGSHFFQEKRKQIDRPPACFCSFNLIHKLIRLVMIALPRNLVKSVGIEYCCYLKIYPSFIQPTYEKRKKTNTKIYARPYRLLDSLVVECWLQVREVPGSIPSQGPCHTIDVIKMVPVVPLFST